MSMESEEMHEANGLEIQLNIFLNMHETNI